MPDQEFVADYLQGKLTSWTFVRRLLKAGVTLGTALTFVALLPAAAKGGDLTQLEQLTAATAASSPDEAAVLERLLMQLGNSLVPIQHGGSAVPLRIALARLAINAANVGGINESFSGNAGNVPYSLSSTVGPAGGINVINAPNLVSVDPQNIAVSIEGNLAEAEVSLTGFVNINVNGQPGVRGSFVNLSGNVGEVEIAFNVPR
jgi:hypothetical protein